MRGLKKMRRLAQLTQQQLARRVRCDRSRISLAENFQVRLLPEEEHAIRRVLMGAIAAQSVRIERTLTARPTSAEVSCAPNEG